MVSLSVNFTTTLTCLLSTTSSDIRLFLNIHPTIVLNNTEPTERDDIRKHNFIVASLEYTLKLTKNMHMEKYKH